MKNRPFALILLSLSVILVSGCGPSKTKNSYHSSTFRRDNSSYYYFTEAHLYLRKGETQKALQSLSKAIEKDPASLYLKKELAITYLQIGDTEKALILTEDILKTDPDNIEVLIISGIYFSASLMSCSASSRFPPVSAIVYPR